MIAVYPLRQIPTDFVSDMGGLCPHGAKIPDCYAGAKWTPNDPAFFLHHAVRNFHLSTIPTHTKR